MNEKVINNTLQNRKKIALFMAGFFILVIARVFIYNFLDKNIVDTTAQMIVSFLFKFVIWVLPVFMYLIFIDKTNPFTYLKLNTSLKKGFFWTLGIVGIGALWQYLETVFLADTIGPASINILFGVIYVPIFEEIPMRGFLLHKLSEIMPFSGALFLSAGFFLLMHIPGWLLIAPVHTAFQILANSFSVFILVGIIGGLITKKSNSLYPSIVLHFIINFISSI